MLVSQLKELLSQSFSSDCNAIFDHAFKELKFYESQKLETSHVFLGVLRSKENLLPVDIKDFRKELGPGNLESQLPIDDLEVSKTVATVVQSSINFAQSLRFETVVLPILLYNFFKLEVGKHTEFLRINRIDTTPLCDALYRAVYSTLIQASPTVEEKINAIMKYVDNEFSTINAKLNILLERGSNRQ